MSSLGKLLNPIYNAISSLLAFYYSLVPNYAIAIALLTVTVMVVLVPLTVKSTRSMLAMQQLQPEIQKVKQRYKDDKVTQQEQMAAIMKENNVSPAGGCLPTLLQFPVFLVLYEVVQGLTHLNHFHQPSPKYIGHTTLLYHNLVHAGGKMTSFGMDLSRSPTSIHGGLLTALPYWIMVAIAIALQYLQYRQMTIRNPKSSGASAQAQQIQKYMPLLFGVIYISFPAAVNVYFIVSTLFRIGQQSLMYRYDPRLREALAARSAQVIDVKEAGAKPPGKGRPALARGEGAGEPGRGDPKSARAPSRGTQPPPSRPSQSSTQAGDSGRGEGRQGARNGSGSKTPTNGARRSGAGPARPANGKGSPSALPPTARPQGKRARRGR